jgi:hypothetical protein
MGERTIPCKMLHRQQRIIATKNQKLSRVAQSHQVLLPRILTEGGEADRTDDFPVVHSLEEAFIRTHHLVRGRCSSGEA